MALNKLALIRYKTIDSCLQNRYRKWTLEDLIEKVSEAIYEYEGVDNGVSKRTIQSDIQLMRSNKLGYNAPIVVIDKKYYAYQDPNYSITNSPINQADVDKLHEIVEILKQLNGFSHFDDMLELLTKIENNLHRKQYNSPTYIQFEGNKQLKGLEFINPLFQAIVQKQAIFLTYKSFKSKKPQSKIYSPYLLKEYRNRWFLIVRPLNATLLITLALDRIESFNPIGPGQYQPCEDIDFDLYFSDVIGVTKTQQQQPITVILKLNKENAPYILTKPLHASQVVLKAEEDYTIIQLCVIHNFELEREVLGFGSSVTVLSPRFLKKRISKILEQAHLNYNKIEPEA